jgi:hypothetical protein
MRRRYRWSREQQCLIEVPLDSRQPSVAPAVFGDLPEYDSPIDGRIVSGRKARREDLKRNRCRPWEGMEQEKKEAARHRAEADRRLDNLAERMAHRAWAEAPERVRRVFRGR